MGEWSTIDLIRAGYCGTLAVSFLVLLRGNHRFVRKFGEEVPVLKLLGHFTLPRLDSRRWLGISLLFLASLICCGAALAPHWAALVGVISYFLCFSQLSIVDTAKRKTFSIPVVLALFALEYWISGEWIVLLLQAVACQVLFFSGLQKIRQSGFRNWFSGRSLRYHILRESLLLDSKFAMLIARNPGFCALLATLVVVFEIGFVATIFAPSVVAVVLVLGALTFHFAIWRVMKINYLPFHGPVYWVFLPAVLELF